MIVPLLAMVSLNILCVCVCVCVFFGGGGQGAITAHHHSTHAPPALSPARAATAATSQGYALFKHMTVADNIVFGPRVRKLGVDLERRCVCV